MSKLAQMVRQKLDQPDVRQPATGQEKKLD